MNIVEKMNMRKTVNRADWIFVFVVSVFFYFLNRTYIQLSDDIGYAFIHPTAKRIYSVLDALSSQANAYIYENGRFLVHTVVQLLCCSKAGHEAFFLLNSCFFAALLIGIIVIVRSEKHSEVNGIPYVLLCLILLLTPSTGQVLWIQIAYAVNYLWVSAIIVWFYIVWNGNCRIGNYLLRSKLFIAICGFVIGSLQESFCIPIAFYFAVYFVIAFVKKQKISNLRLVFIISFYLGVFICVIAPGNFLRLDSPTQSVGLFAKISRFTDIYLRQYFVWATCLLVFALWRKGKLLYSVRAYTFWWCCFLANSLLGVIAVTNGHQFFLSSISVIVLILLSIQFIFETNRMGFPQMLRLICICFLAFIYVRIYDMQSRIKRGWEDNYLSKTKIERNEGYVVAKDLYKIKNEVKSNSFLYKYISLWILEPYLGNKKDVSNGLSSLSFLLSEGNNGNLIKAAIPEKKEIIIQQGEDVDDDIYALHDSKCYVLKVGQNKPYKKTSFLCSYKKTNLGKVKEMIMNLTHHSKSADNTILTLPKESYAFVDGNFRYVIIDYSPDLFNLFCVKKIE